MSVQDGILIIATGGTIEKSYSEVNETFEFRDDDPLSVLLSNCLRREATYERVLRKDSLDMGNKDRTDILNALEGVSESRILIVHGTSTLTDTAEFLSEMEGLIGNKTVVLTGSLYPHGLRREETSFNMGLAYGAVQLLDPGVYIAMHGRVLPAGSVRKEPTSGTFVPVSA